MVTCITKYCQRSCVDQHGGFLVTKMKNTGGKPVKFLETTTCKKLKIFLKIYLCSNYVMYLRKENQKIKRKKKKILMHQWKYVLREKCPNTEFFLVCIFPYLDWIRKKWTRKNSVFGENDALMKNLGILKIYTLSSKTVACVCNVSLTLFILGFFGCSSAKGGPKGPPFHRIF